MKNLIPSLLMLALSALYLPANAQVPVMNSYPSATATIFLDFDGQFVKGSFWGGAILAAPAGMSSSDITVMFNRVAEDFRPFNLNITTDSTVYFAAPIKQRQRIIVTTSSAWYGSAGGASFVGSFTYGNETPSFVFNQLLGNDVKNVAEAISHEAGHTLGLQHQTAYDAMCNKISDYAAGQGSGEIGWAPIMGVGYYRNVTTWHNGSTVYGCSSIQDDLSIIAGAANNFGFRTDDIANNIAGATDITVLGEDFSADGIINQTNDADVFRLDVPSPTDFKLTAIPQNVGANDEGADIDIRVSLLNAAGDTLAQYNPGTLLNAGADTNILNGTYYLVVDGVGNINHTDYGSLGHYTLVGKLSTLLPVKKLKMNGKEEDGVRSFGWTYESDEPVKEFVVESSSDGLKFNDVAHVSPKVKAFSYQPVNKQALQYRVRAVAISDEHAYYSNVILLRSDLAKNQLKIVSSLVSNSVNLNSSGTFNYQLIDGGGRTIASGAIRPGYNSIPVQASAGLLLLRYQDGLTTHTEKLIKQ